MMIYEPWLQRLNLRMPETTTDFVNVMGDYMYSEEQSVGTRWGEKGQVTVNK